MKCPVCGKYEFDKSGDWDICPVCNWENDNIQADDHNYAGGANDLSVNEARIEYFLIGSSYAKDAEEYRNKYRTEKSKIAQRFRGINRAEQPELAEEEICLYKQLRQNYMDSLNSLLQSLAK